MISLHIEFTKKEKEKVLAYLEETGKAFASDIAEDLNMTPLKVIRIFRELDKDGLVKEVSEDEAIKEAKQQTAKEIFDDIEEVLTWSEISDKDNSLIDEYVKVKQKWVKE